MRRSCLFAHNSINRPRPYLSYHSRNSSNSSRLILSLLRVNRIHNNVWRRSPLHAHSTGHVTKTRELNGGKNKQYREPSNNKVKVSKVIFPVFEVNHVVEDSHFEGAFIV